MPKFKTFDSFRIDVRSRDHNPPHFHAISPGCFHALIRIDTLEVTAGKISEKAYKEAVEWAEENRTALMDEWRRLNERD